MSDLVKRLRKLHDSCGDWSEYWAYDMESIGEAADRIDALEARFAALNHVGDLFVRAANDFVNAKRDGREDAAAKFYNLTAALDSAYPGDVDRMRSDYGWTKPTALTPSESPSAPPPAGSESTERSP